MNGALKGIRVIDYTQIVAGPFAGSLLSDMGADVIKVEPTWESLKEKVLHLYQMKLEII